MIFNEEIPFYALAFFGAAMVTYLDLLTAKIQVGDQIPNKLEKSKFPDINLVFRNFPIVKNTIIYYLIINGLIGFLAYYLITNGLINLNKITDSEMLAKASSLKGYSKALYAVTLGFLFNSVATAEFIPGFRYGSLRKIITTLFSDFDDLVENIIVKSKTTYFTKIQNSRNLNLRQLGLDVGKHLLQLANGDSAKIKKAQAFLQDLSKQNSVVDGLYLVHDQYGRNVIKILYK